MLKRITVLLALLLAPVAAFGQSSVLPYYYSAAGVKTPVGSSNPLPVSASVSASISGFPTIQSTGTPISVTTGGVTGTLPTGAVVVASNVGTTNAAYCKLGASATTSDQYIAPSGGWFAFTVGANTQLTCITSTSTTTVNMVGGSGLPTGTGGGGGGGGGGGAVTVADGSDVAEGATADAAASAGGVGSVTAKLRLMTTQLGTINTTLGTPFQAGGAVIAAGDVASGGADSGNPVKGGGVFITTPTAITTGQRGAFQLDANSNLRVVATSTATTGADGIANASIAQTLNRSTGTTAVFLYPSVSYLLNGATFDRPRSVAGDGQAATGIAAAGCMLWNSATYDRCSGTTAGMNVLPGTPASWGIGTSTQNSASVANGHLVLGQFNTTPTTITSTNMSPLQLDNAGNLLVNIKAGASSGAVAQGSTTSGQTGGLTQAAVTTAAPSYTTAQTSPLSLDTNGSLRVNVTTALGLAQASTTSGQTGSLIMAATTTTNPSNTTAQTNYLSADVKGNLRTVLGGGTPITATATGTTGATTATLATSASVTTYICGLSVRSNATAAATGNITVTGVITATMNFTHWTAPNASGLGVSEELFTPCIPASGANQAIAVVSPAPGTGGVVSVSAWGYQQ